ncbi:MAG: peptidoglycan editing factor PgeF [Bacilli bacterium]|jgi:YfiH family protein|nr:peptidoglycan editing factor PgeF [Bacilli bacterium]
MNTYINNDNIIALTTTKNDHYHKTNKDNYLNIDNDYQIKFKDIITPLQAHTDKLIKVMSKQTIINEECDALYTTLPDIHIGVLTADCLPLLVHCQNPSIICAIHAGWVGSSKLITYKSIKYLMEHEHLNPEETTIYLGPSITLKNYEVQQDLVNKIMIHSQFNPQECFIKLKDNKYLYDNIKFNINQLKALGIKEQNIMLNNRCTYEDDEYYSYRQDQTTNRLLNMIVLKNNI